MPLDMTDVLRELKKNPPRRAVWDPAPTLRVRWSWVALVAACILGWIALGCLAGCGTVIPPTVTADEIAYDGNEQNAGIVGVAENQSIIITASKREYYNSLIAIYGAATWPDRTPVFLPHVKADAGMTARPDGNFEITRASLAQCTLMHQWLKMGKLPTTSTP